jgi:hypothetical protein
MEARSEPPSVLIRAEEDFQAQFIGDNAIRASGARFEFS